MEECVPRESIQYLVVPPEQGQEREVVETTQGGTELPTGVGQGGRRGRIEGG